jgi:hypothetical protein
MRTGAAVTAGVVLGLSLAFLAVAVGPANLSLPLVRTCVGAAQPMARIELLFGMGRTTGEVSEKEWLSFLDAEVTPRFPDGFTVLTGYGQWRNAAGVLAKETSRVLLIWIALAPENDARIEAIRTAWKARFNQESVMRVDDTSCVSW